LALHVRGPGALHGLAHGLSELASVDAGLHGSERAQRARKSHWLRALVCGSPLARSND